MKKISIIAVALMVVVGCDYLSDSKERVELARLEQQRQEQEVLQRDNRVRALKTYLIGKVGLVEERMKAISNDLAVVLADAEKLEKRASTIMSAVGDGGKAILYEVRFLRLLKDDEVNRLAVKYLSGGFSVQAEGFVEKVRDARMAEKKYCEAVKSVEEQHKQAMKDSEKWVGASKSQRDSEIRRLENEISAIEKKLASTRREMVTAGSRNEWVNKMVDYEREISKKRCQIDYLRNPDVNRKIETRAAVERQNIVRDANREKNGQLYDVDRRMKPLATVVEITNSVHKDTMEALQLEIKGRIKKLQSERCAVAKKLILGREILLELPVCSLGKLDTLKMRADKELLLN